jgi:catechol 2,3-dioxygenase-like lactoylglutathione lyase family enzyme
MLDHIGFGVADFAVSRTFYLAALGAIGLEIVAEGDTWAMMGRSGRAEIWFGTGPTPPQASVHIAFQVTQRWLVEEFHAAGLAAGGRDNGPPGLRPHYHADYYAAFLLDPDGHNIEAVCHMAP